MGVKKRKNSNKLLQNFVLATLLVFLITLVVYFAFGSGEKSVGSLVGRLMNYNQSDPFVLDVKSDVQVNVSSDNAKTLAVGTDVTDMIDNFFIMRYKQYGELQEADYSQLYLSKSADLVVDEAVHRFITKERGKADIFLTFRECFVDLHYTNAVHAGGSIVEINLTESTTYKFDGMNGQESVCHGVEHFFVMKNKNGYWQIDKHEEKSDFYSYAYEVLEDVLSKSGLSRSDVDESYLNENIAAFEQQLEDNKHKYKVKREKVEAKYHYDRDSAVRYALEWTSTVKKVRNTDQFPDFGDDSVNFTSQCIYAGGIPMDTQGYWGEYWKCFDKIPDPSNSKSGYTDSWVDGGDFFHYITENEGFGMVARPSTLANMEKGDILQFARPRGNTDKVYYQCIIVDFVNGEPIVCGNDDDLVNFPMAALGFNFYRPIKIYGYNTIDVSWEE